MLLQANCLMMVSRASSWCYTAVILAVLTTTLVSADLNHGHFETADGSKCTWFELKKSSSMNTLTAACMCKDATGKGQSYSCQYEGDLRECHEYKHSPRDFYEAVVQRIARKFSFHHLLLLSSG